MEKDSANGIVHERSGHSIGETLNRIELLLQTKGIVLFAIIDHSGEAEKVGLHMRPTKLLVFGNPKAGTPLMTASPSIAIDLPLKILVWEDGDGSVWLSYNTPAYLAERHHLPPELVPALSAVEALVEKAAEE
jgi:uncharacterized protein (DUF302 family)